MTCCCCDFFFYIGLAYILTYTCAIAKQIFLNYFPAKSNQDWQSRFGKDSYALITGATAGIGREWVNTLAAKGLNLILWSRNPTKLQAVKLQTLKKHPGLDIIIIARDFKHCAEKDFFETAMEPIKDLDISILVNNVGVSIQNLQPYENMKPEDVCDQININTIPQSVLNSIMIPKMLLRADESAIIDLSSISAFVPTPLLEIYGTTKAFNHYFTSGLSNYYATEKLSFLSVLPGPVDTVMYTKYKEDLGDRKEPAIVKYIASKTDECVRGSVVTLGRHGWTGGSFKHTLIALFVEGITNFDLLKDSILFVEKFITRWVLFWVLGYWFC